MEAINSLINFYLKKGYIQEDDIVYCGNRLAHSVGLESFKPQNWEAPFKESLDQLINCALQKGIIEDFSYQKDQLINQITDIFMPKPSEFRLKTKELSNGERMEALYQMGKDSDYIKVHHLEKNINYAVEDLEISINLSKPEKDPREIEKLKGLPSSDSDYPLCALCYENIGFQGSISQASRIHHRVIELKLHGEDWFFQFSPYGYFDRHGILIKKEHSDMEVGETCLRSQLEFVKEFPEYFIGNNADLPIVGGSILNHDHYQGGVHTFKMERAASLQTEKIKGVQIDYINWYLTTLKLSSSDPKALLAMGNHIMNQWYGFASSTMKIYNSPGKRCNAVNFITSRKNNRYQCYIILRNNYRDDSHPHGLYHIDPQYFNIKKENIGLIEAMGLAILPGRLKGELEDIQRALQKGYDLNNHHQAWLEELRGQGETSMEFLYDQLAQRFKKVIACCNVFKHSEKEQIQGCFDQLYRSYR